MIPFTTVITVHPVTGPRCTAATTFAFLKANKDFVAKKPTTRLGLDPVSLRLRRGSRYRGSATDRKSGFERRKSGFYVFGPMYSGSL